MFQHGEACRILSRVVAETSTCRIIQLIVEFINISPPSMSHVGVRYFSRLTESLRSLTLIRSWLQNERSQKKKISGSTRYCWRVVACIRPQVFPRCFTRSLRLSAETSWLGVI